MLPLPFPVRDANASNGDKNLGDLPEWDLSDLYSAMDGDDLNADLEQMLNRRIEMMFLPPRAVRPALRPNRATRRAMPAYSPLPSVSNRRP